MAECMDIPDQSDHSAVKEESLKGQSGTEGESTSDNSYHKRACIICLGMAGSGKTTFMQVGRSPSYNEFIK